jgi:hypothetical protein
MEEPIKPVDNRQPDGRFGPNNNANPAGRPKGQTLKEYQAERFRKMSVEEKEEYLKTISLSERWRMAEGNPHQSSDMRVEVPPIPILSDALPKDHGDKQGDEPSEKN